MKKGATKKRIDFPKLIVSIIVCEVIGSIGSLFTMPAIASWYASLAKPAWTLPNWLFAPVWTTLFFLMGIALYLVWMKGIRAKGVKEGLWLFGIQFALNVLWSYLFFGLQSPALGLIGIIVLWVFILATMISFYKISRPAAYVLVPYIAWVTIATLLNYSVMVLNA